MAPSTELEHWNKGEPGRSFTSKENPSIDVYIQPGGCLEIGETPDVDVAARNFVHLCPEMLKGLEEIINYWRQCAV